ncbi:MAG TPA: thermonuclease family protein [Candidatus Nanoarchaeia archaeon]|nr:thermonuclease family protein [Candidatus Nanoarchaeia archaeon]
MDKRYALLIAFLITGLIVSNIFIFNSFSIKGQNLEKVVIAKITDGDTLKLSDGRIVRLVNINSPEKGMSGSNLAKDFLIAFENKSADIEIIGVDKYQRNLARIYSPDYLNLEIVKMGLASKFLVQDSELSDFSKAEESAINSNLGIWKKSKFTDCFDSKIDRIKEEIKITNSCLEINFQGWMLKDESRKIYFFKNFSFGKIILHSFQGEDNSTDLFWNNKGDIWNNDRDSLYLFDSEGGIAHYETYGY